MSAEIFSPPAEIKEPSLGGLTTENVKERIANYHKEQEQYIENLKNWLNKNGYNGKNAGETIKFPVADGYAVYMVISMKPLRLMHVPIGDAWSFQYIHLMTAKEVQEKIDQEKALAKLFGKKEGDD